MSDFAFRDVLANSIRYWETRRVLYNLVLALIVGAFFIAGLPASKSVLSFGLAQGLFLLAVLANVAYCAAYPVDVFAQLSALRSTWLRVRWVLFIVGLVFAAIITRFFAEGMFHGGAV
ncbi:hypothetical protein [Caenimonas aquaedulcis]|uniref:Uncharacterized protein n=1 Tax=Caenimonas aquaedulcis TaxID=2793270 RepID=A0A931H7Y5_9BURK|nr:hypothetical protein [Caenimonas aquaedulcis]MBG9390087.1 hypothetical protein [Caenimonas aquaedulcis]